MPGGDAANAYQDLVRMTTRDFRIQTMQQWRCILTLSPVVQWVRYFMLNPNSTS